MEKKVVALFLTLVFFIGLIGIISAIPDPSPFYCKNMGYTHNNTDCIFSDGETCGLWDFYNGECGQEYVMVLDCVESGNSLEPGYGCCEGLIRVGIYSPGPINGTCIMAVGGWPICLACGDGICDSNLENECNCAEDCPETREDFSCVTDEDCEIKDSPYCCGAQIETVPGCFHADETPTVPECSQLSPCPGLVAADSCLCENNVCVGKKEAQCDDTDGGKNYYAKGSGNPHCDAPCGVFIDSCQDSKILIEYYCDGSELKTESYTCPNGCENGACISLPARVKESLQNGKEETIENKEGEELNLRLMENNRIRLTAGDISADCDCELKEEKIDNKTRLSLELSNGKNAEIKIMPDAASQIALERLRIKVCSEANNCFIELKEVGVGNEARAAYEIQAERHAKLLAMFRMKMQVKARVDAETGELIRVEKPWWAFLASEPEE